MSTKAISAGALGELEANDGRIGRAIELSAEHAEIYQAMLKTAPTMAAARNNLGVAYGDTAGYLFDAGRLEEARDMTRAAASVGDKMPDRSSLAQNLMFWFADLAEFEDELGDEAAAGKALLEARRLLDTEFKQAGADFSVSMMRQRYAGSAGPDAACRQ